MKIKKATSKAAHQARKHSCGIAALNVLSLAWFVATSSGLAWTANAQIKYLVETKRESNVSNINQYCDHCCPFSLSGSAIATQQFKSETIQVRRDVVCENLFWGQWVRTASGTLSRIQTDYKNSSFRVYLDPQLGFEPHESFSVDGYTMWQYPFTVQLAVDAKVDFDFSLDKCYLYTSQAYGFVLYRYDDDTNEQQPISIKPEGKLQAGRYRVYGYKQGQAVSGIMPYPGLSGIGYPGLFELSVREPVSCSTYKWRGGVGGRWSDPSNWDVKDVPSSEAVVVFDQPGFTQVTVDGAVTVKSLFVSNSAANVVFQSGSGGRLQFAAVGATLSVEAGSLTIGDLNGGVVGSPGLSIRAASGSLLEVEAGGVLSAGTVAIEQGAELSLLSDVSAQAIVQAASVDNRGLVAGNGRIDGVLANHGRVRPRLSGSASVPSVLVVETLESSETAPQSAIEIEVGAQPPLLGTISSIAVRAAASLRNRLVIDHAAEGFSIGSRLSCISRDASTPLARIAGQFDSFEGLGWGEDKWVAVLHEGLRPKTLIDTRADERTSNVQMLVMSRPRVYVPTSRQGRPYPVIGPQRPKLMFMTHGTKSSIPSPWQDGQGGFAEMAYLASTFAANRGLASLWDSVTLNWSHFSTGVSSALDFDPFESAFVGNAIGQSLARLMSEEGISFSSVHALSHSSGSWLANSFVAELIRLGLVPSSGTLLTGFDVFAPPGDGWCDSFSRSVCAALGPFGANGSEAEQYLDSTLPPLGLPGTNAVIPTAVNVDVTALNPTSTVDPIELHAWPYVWYTETLRRALLPTPIDCRDVPDGVWGFPRSLIARDVLGLLRNCPLVSFQGAVGQVVKLPGSEATAGPTATWTSALDAANAQVGGAGGVSTTTSSVTYSSSLSHRSGIGVALHETPSWVVISLPVLKKSGLVRFDVDFSACTAGDVLFELFVSGARVWVGRRSEWPTDLVGTGWIATASTLLPGQAAFEWRFTPSADFVGQVRVAAPEFGYAPCVGDLNNDAVVDDLDFSIFVVAYDNVLDTGGDLNADGVTDDRDFQLFVVSYDRLVCP